jgi:hypothetical protein
MHGLKAIKPRSFGSFGRKKPWTRPEPLVPKQTGTSAIDKGPARSTGWLAHIRTLPCLVCQPGAQQSPTHAHHVRCLLPRTMGKRVTDYIAAPLCQWHHQYAPSALHKGDEASFWEAHGIDIRAAVCRLLEASRHEEAKVALAALKGTTEAACQ